GARRRPRGRRRQPVPRRRIRVRALQAGRPALRAELEQSGSPLLSGRPGPEQRLVGSRLQVLRQLQALIPVTERRRGHAHALKKEEAIQSRMASSRAIATRGLRPRLQQNRAKWRDSAEGPLVRADSVGMTGEAGDATLGIAAHTLPSDARPPTERTPMIDPFCHTSSIAVAVPAEAAFKIMADGIAHGRWAW